MGRKSVAVLDIRSSEVAVFVGERGVNGTFQFDASKTVSYEGYMDGSFLDEKQLTEAVTEAFDAVGRICDRAIRTLYIGVPGEFTRLLTQDQTTSFQKRRKVTDKDTATLYSEGKKSEMSGYRCIRATSMIYITSDNRRVVDPIGLTSSSLRGLLSYFYCSDYFIRTMEKIFEGRKVELRYLPTQLAMANCLISSETRDECVIFLDVGDLSTTAMVLLGSGALEQETFPVGRLNIVSVVMEKLNVPYEVARALIGRVNLNAKTDFPPSYNGTEFYISGEPYIIHEGVFIDAVKEGLDTVCQEVSRFLEANGELKVSSRPIYITGEGLVDIRGALEHLSNRLSCICEMAVPDLPYYNKPAMSSRIALIGMACDDSLSEESWLSRIFNGFRR